MADESVRERRNRWRSRSCTEAISLGSGCS
jgi:hypothetical protein